MEEITAIRSKKTFDKSMAAPMALALAPGITVSLHLFDSWQVTHYFDKAGRSEMTFSYFSAKNAETSRHFRESVF